MSVRKQVKLLLVELGRNPFFPILFLGEATKAFVYTAVSGSPGTSVVLASLAMAVLSTIVWLFCYEHVQWGINVVSTDDSEKPR